MRRSSLLVLAILVLSGGFNALIKIAESLLMPWRVADENREVAV